MEFKKVDAPIIFRTIEVRGEVVPGHPLVLYDEPELERVVELSLRADKECFAYFWRGEDSRDNRVGFGDLILCYEADNTFDDETVLAEFDNHEFVIGRMVIEENHIRLEGRGNLPVRYAQLGEFQIHGIVTSTFQNLMKNREGT